MTAQAVSSASATDAGAPSAPRQPLVRIRPPGRWAALHLGEVLQFRDLLAALVARDIKLRYRQTALGIAWVVLQPLLASVIFELVFGVIARLPSSGAVPYFVMALSGQIAWNLFANVVTRTSQSLLTNSNLVSKIYFPRLTLPLSSVGAVLLDLVITLGVLAVFLVCYHCNPGWRLLLLPLWLLILLLISLGSGLLLAGLAVSYRDVNYLVPVAMQLLMYVSPVGYTMAVVHTRLPARLFWLYALNPLASSLEGFRWSTLGSGDVQWGYVAYSLAVGAAMFVFGAVMFKRMERRFADVI